MAFIEYTLYRAKFVRSAQKSLFPDGLTTADLFKAAIEARSAFEIREGVVWHIGNIQQLSAEAGYFAVGRTTNATISKFDSLTGNFIEEQQETSPYTHCVFDTRLGLLGIARKSTLAPTTTAIASKVEQLLSEAPAIRDSKITVEILEIRDPDDFLKAIDGAWQVSKFTAWFRGPNPFDADEQFQKPLSVYLNAANGNQGKAEIQGTDLNRDVVKKVARSTAATGNKASARIKTTKDKKPQTITLKGDAIKRVYEDAEHEPEKVIADLTADYMRVRNDD